MVSLLSVWHAVCQAWNAYMEGMHKVVTLGEAHPALHASDVCRVGRVLMQHQRAAVPMQPANGT